MKPSEKFLKVSIFFESTEIDKIITSLFLNGFYSFEEKENSIEIYIDEKDKDILISAVLNSTNSKIHFLFEEFENKNWNNEWEKSIEPVFIKNKIVIYPSWKKHDIQQLKNIIKIQIDPKMAFGTGHNETTCLVLEQMITYLDKNDKTLFDFGTGTGILAIAGIKLGIMKSVVNEIDEDSILNALENIKINKVKEKVKLYDKDIIFVKENNFDVITANIISSVIIDNINNIKKKLKKSGKLFLSGILKEEESKIKNILLQNGFNIINILKRAEWIGIYAQKIK